MTIADRVRTLMSDGEPRTVREIAVELEPQRKDYALTIYIIQVRKCMVKMEKWGEAERCDTVPKACGHDAIVWRVTA